MQLVIGRIARAHGIGGEVAVDVRTDAAEERFATGCPILTHPADRGPLTISAARWHAGRLLVRFAEVADRTAAEALQGTFLVADSGTSPPGEPDQWWDHELIGLAAVSVDGRPVGEITDVAHPPGHDLLVIRRPDGAEAFVPFVAAMVPTVDIAGGRIVLDPPDGLLEL